MKNSKRPVFRFIGGIILLVFFGKVVQWGWQVKNRCLIPPIPFVPTQLLQIPFYVRILEQVLRQDTEMPPWWELQVKPSENSPLPYEKIAVQNQNIWLATFDAIARYTPANKKVFTYNLIADKKISSILDILSSENGDFWVTGRYDVYLRLLHYNEKEDVFDVVKDWNVNTQTLREGGRTLVDDRDGNLLTAYQNNILLYTPTTKAVRLLLPENFAFVVNSLAVSDDKIWFTVNETLDLWVFDLRTGTVANYGQAPIMIMDGVKDSHGSIAVDHLGRVWVGYSSRLELGKDGRYYWYLVPRQPQFITEGTFYSDDYFYSLPIVSSVDISSDGNIWFSTQTGIIKYDPRLDNWCLSAPGLPHSLAEDKDGNLWTVSFGYFLPPGLYKYKLNP